MKDFIYIVIIFCLFVIASCTNDETCRKDRYVAIHAGFYTIKTDTLGIHSRASLTIDSITIQGLDSIGQLVDSILYNKKKDSKIYLPLHKFKNQSRFIVSLNDTIDTLTILHTNYDQYLSLECGCIKTHSIDTVLTTNHFIDSILINNHDINTIDAEHIQIYHN
jgi:hypothetical protein